MPLEYETLYEILKKYWKRLDLDGAYPIPVSPK